MKTSKDARVIIYGAVSRAPSDIPNKFNKIKNYLHLVADRISIRFGFPEIINYKNYERRWTYNRGDLAISDSVHESLRQIGCAKPIVRANWEELAELKLTDQDIVMVAGSGYIHPKKTGNLPARVFSDYDAIKKSGCRVSLIGIGVNVLLDWDHSKATSLTADSRAVLEALFGICSSITVRDEQSQKFIRQLGNYNTPIIGDPALFLSEQFSEPTIQRQDTKLRIGLSIPFHGIEPTEWIRSNIKEFIEFLRKLQQSKNAKFEYYLHYDSERLVYEVMRDSGLDVTLRDGDTHTLLSHYRCLDLHIGGMLHSCIMASSQRIPTIALAYDAKHFGFFKLLEREEFCIYNQSLDYSKLNNLIDQIVNSQATQRQQLDARIKHLETSYLEAIAKAVATALPAPTSPRFDQRENSQISAE
ncbi:MULTISPECIES: polysaccharide pyruvyl transferase family protein [unclassified Acidovorax]|uniref:polysaccharide pyruvyl transferase family protein n=1 Tax=unclassified Acidovorax TaxID=2684926 RepID=UPI000B402247|nr:MULTISPECIES: polysaccharide pyruvyl transferase family protein [unclassified Acidovorax]MBU4422568.1 polysaccharide pyruvyl transferase family protein [Gammaproteobacteria bacterium]